MDEFFDDERFDDFYFLNDKVALTAGTQWGVIVEVLEKGLTVYHRYYYPDDEGTPEEHAKSCENMINQHKKSNIGIIKTESLGEGSYYDMLNDEVELGPDCEYDGPEDFYYVIFSLVCTNNANAIHLLNKELRLVL